MKQSLSHNKITGYKSNVSQEDKVLVIIYCQAPADIIYVLNIYEQSLSDQCTSVYIYVINVQPIYVFLRSLNLKAHIVFIPYHPISLKNIVAVHIEKIRINYLWRENFNRFYNGNVFFFSRFEDWLTPAFICRFSKRRNIEIFYVSHYDNSYSLFKEKKNNFRSIVFIFLLKYLTGAKFQDKINEKRPEFLWKNYPIKKITMKVNIDYLSKYKYKLEFPGQNHNKSNVLFFVSSCNTELFEIKSYIKTSIKIISGLQKYGVNVYIKGHPRMGVPEAIKEAAGFEIPSYIPGEFIDVKGFKFCFGIETVSMCFFAKNGILPTYSLLKIFPSSFIINKNNVIRYLIQQSENKIQFIDNIKEFSNLFDPETK